MKMLVYPTILVKTNNTNKFGHIKLPYVNFCNSKTIGRIVGFQIRRALDEASNSLTSNIYNCVFPQTTILKVTDE